MRGANVSGRHKSAPYFDFHQQPDFDVMADEWGMNGVRFLVEWAAIEPERDVFDDAYLDQVARRVEWMTAAGLLVVIDMHQDLYGEGFGNNGAPVWTCAQDHYDAFEPTTPWFANYANEHVIACYDAFWASEDLQGHYAEAWRRLAARLAGYPAVVGFDVMNEPYWGSTGPAAFDEGPLTVLYERVVAAVRGEAPDWVAFLEPSASRNLGIATHLQTFSFRDVVYAPHSYDSEAEGGGGFTIERREAVLGNLEALGREAGWLDAALWIGEYGGPTEDGGIVDYMDAQYDGAGIVAAGTMYWNYTKDGGYGILDADGNEKPALMSVLVRPYPARVAGDPLSYEFDEATRTFTLRFDVDSRITAATEIVVPARVYPEGVKVACGGCEVEVTAGRVLLRSVPAGDATAVVVSPN